MNTDLNELTEQFFATNNRYEAWEILDYLDGIVDNGTTERMPVISPTC